MTSVLQAVDGEKCVGAIVCKLDRHKGCTRRGYIAMLAVDHDYRKLGIGWLSFCHTLEVIAWMVSSPKSIVHQMGHETTSSQSLKCCLLHNGTDLMSCVCDA